MILSASRDVDLPLLEESDTQLLNMFGQRVFDLWKSAVIPVVTNPITEVVTIVGEEVYGQIMLDIGWSKFIEEDRDGFF